MTRLLPLALLVNKGRRECAPVTGAVIGGREAEIAGKYSIPEHRSGQFHVKFAVVIQRQVNASERLMVMDVDYDGESNRRQ